MELPTKCPLQEGRPILDTGHIKVKTCWYHEWVQCLPARATARRELRLHATRDFAYTIVFGSLAWVVWQGWCVWLLVSVLLFEILITLWDFLEEDRSRPLPA